MNHVKVKNYAFAWEALSRIPGEESAKLARRVMDLLADAIYNEERYTPPTKQAPDDEIPF